MSNASEYNRKFEDTTKGRLHMGKIWYVEPNDFDNNGLPGGYDVSINRAYEDYNMIVDLVVELVDKYECTADDNKQIEFASNNRKYIHFIGGNNGYLTTDYTNLSFNNINNVGGNQECMGIDSIDIQYSSWFTPTITINFTDVRGASLMLPQEGAMYKTVKKEQEEYLERREDAIAKGLNPDDVKRQERNNLIGGSFFKSMFMFPPPIFYLRVKGFYGDAVIYRLALSDMKLSFDASSGNFKIQGQFIGYMYGVFADLPLVYCIVSPKMKYGLKYWEENTNATNGRFRYFNTDGEYTNTPVHTYGEYRKAIGNFNGSALKNLEKNGNVKSYKDKSDELNRVENMKKTFPFKTDSTTYFRGWRYTAVNKSAYYTFVVGDKNRKSFESNLKRLLDDYVDAKFGTKESEKKKYKESSYYKNVYNLKPAIEIDCKNGALVGTLITPLSTFNSKDGSKFFAYDFFNTIENECRYTKYNGKVYYYENQLGIGTEEGKETYEYLDKRADSLNKEIEKIVEKFDKEKEAAVEKAIGFMPSIKNAFHMTLCHMDTFMNVFNMYLDEVYNDMKNGKRAIKEFVVNKEDCDAQKVDETQLPPFPLFSSEIWNKGDRKRVTMWPPDYDAKLSEMPEVKFVEELLSAAGQLSKETYDIAKEQALANEEAAGEARYLPTIMMDIVFNNENLSNPYYQISNDLKNGENSDAWFNRIILVFMFRLYYFVLTHRGGELDDENSNLLKRFGAAEAVNVYGSLGAGTFSKIIKKAVEKYSDSGAAEKVIDKFFPETGGRVNFGTVFKNIAESDGKFFGNNEFCWFKKNGSNFLPIGEFSENKIKTYQKTFGSVKVDDDIFKGSTAKIICFDLLAESNNLFSIVDSDKMSSFIPMVDIPMSDGTNGTLDNFFMGDNDSTKAAIDTYIGDGLTLAKLVTSDYNTNKDFMLLGEFCRVFYLKGKKQDTKSKSLHCNKVYNDEADSSLFTTNLVLSTNTKNDVYKEAYLFVMSVTYDEYDGSFISTCSDNSKTSKNGYRTYIDILVEGAYYWRYNEYWRDNKRVDPIAWTGSGVKPDVDELPKCRGRYGLYVKTGEDKGKEDGSPYIKVMLSDAELTTGRQSALMEIFTNFADSDAFRKIWGFFTEKAFITNDSNLKKINGFEYFSTFIFGGSYGNEVSDSLLKQILNKVFYSIDVTQKLTEKTDKPRDIENKVFSSEEEMKSTLNKATTEFVKCLVKNFNGLTSFGETVQKTVDPVDKVNELLSSNDVKLSTYLILKNLYDKWLCGLDIKNEFRVGSNNGNAMSKFVFIDSLYRNIGCKLLVDVKKLDATIKDYCHSSENHVNESSVYQMLARVAEQSNCLFMAVPFMFGLSEGGNGEVNIKDSMVNMFSVKKYSEARPGSDKSTFVCMYTYKPSSNVSIDDDGYDDGFDLGGTIDDNCLIDVPAALLEDNKDFPIIPAFGVSYGKQNQGFFKNISLDTNNPTQSEYTVRSTMNIANHAGEGPQEVESFGQDIYRVFSNYAYKCSVTMMGNAMITPLMYFQLNNIPLWKGAYQITSVKHSITPGNMETTFEGYRVCKYAYPLVEGDVLCDLNIAELSSSNSSSSSSNANEVAWTGGTGGSIGHGVEFKPIGKNIVSSPNRKIKYLVIHYTCSTSSGKGKATAVRNGWTREDSRAASADFVVDDETMVQSNPDPRNYFCYAVGDKLPGRNWEIRNQNTVSIEVCSSVKSGDWHIANQEGYYFTDKTLNNAVKLAKILMDEYNIPIGNVKRHFDASGKLCPGVLGWNTGDVYDGKTGQKTGVKNNNAEWEKFLARLK